MLSGSSGSTVRKLKTSSMTACRFSCGTASGSTTYPFCSQNLKSSSENGPSTLPMSGETAKPAAAGCLQRQLAQR